MEWSLAPGDDGTFRVLRDGEPIVSLSYVFWGRNWEWIGGNDAVRNVRVERGETAFEIELDRLSIHVAARMTSSAPALFSVQYTVASYLPQHDLTGGGLEFRLAPGVGSAAPRSDGAGVVWATPEGAAIAFDPPLPRTSYDPSRGVLRCLFIGKDVEPGTRTVTLTVTLPAGGTVQPSLAQRYGSPDRRAWHAGTLPWDRWPIDVSFLNDGDRPAGRHGRVRARGDRLAFEDGTQARFWGTNLQAYALFRGTRDDVARQARRIAALGYNLVRIHHHDSGWVTPNVISPGPTSQALDAGALDAIDWWVKCLEDAGVYVWFDLHVGRRFLPGDAIDGFGEIATRNGDAKGFNYVNARIEELMQRFAEAYLDRVNRYTKRRYTSDPALVAVLITNENDLTTHAAGLFLPESGNALHRRKFVELASSFAERVGLPVEKSLETWQPGPAKIALNEIEHDFDERAIRHLRSIGLRSLIATTSYWGDDPLFSLPALSTGDVVDVHAYGAAESLGADPRHEANFVDWIGAAQIAGKPLTISEWNVEYPKRDRFVAPLYVAAVASLQGWDAPMLYGYLQSGVESPGAADPWSTWNDPAISALMPAAALLFRQAHVDAARKTYRLDLSRRDVYESATSPADSAAIRTLVEQSKLTIGLPDIPELSWDGPAAGERGNAIVVDDPRQDLLPPGASVVRSDTGQIQRDWRAGIETIDTPLSQSAIGWVGGRSVHLTDVDIELRTPKAAVALTSLDRVPIASSRRLLLTTVAQVEASPGGRLPYLAQPIEGTLRLRSAGPLRVTPLPATPPGANLGRRTDGSTEVRPTGGRCTIRLTGEATHWFILTR